mgnify:CR=1 FL=1
MKLLTTRPSFDIATSYLSGYGALLVEQATQWGHIVTDLFKEQATTEKFETEIVNNDMFIGFGHGSKTRFIGHDMQTLLQDTVNPDAVSGKDTYLASCLTAVRLGPAMIEKGCPEFHGYQGDFVFVYHPDYYNQGKILEDPYAKAFFDSALTTGYAMLLGKEPFTVYQETVDRYKYWWDWWKKQPDPMGDSILTWLNWDRQNFVTITPDGIRAMEASLPVLGLAIPVGAAAVALFLLSGSWKKLL